MSDTLKCPKCGAENPKKNKFCDSCGFKVSAPAPKEEPAKKAEKPAEKPAERAAVVEKAAPVEKKKPKPVEKEAAFVPYEPDKSGVSIGGFLINWETLIWLGIIVITLLTRFYDLGAKPLHHDESMHAFYGWKLFKGQGYSYNPMMHGPFHYHANALIYFLFGASDYTARVAPAIYGVIGVLLIYFLKPYLGKKGTLATAFIMAISPMFMYQSRFIREDIFMAVDTLAMAIGLFRYFDSRQPKWLYLAAIGLALSWCTKEATYITLFIFGTFFIIRWFWEYAGRHNAERTQQEGKIYPLLKYWFGGSGLSHFLWALGIFVTIHALFYFNKENLPGVAGFFKNAKGIWDGYTWALTYWLGQQGVERGSQPVYYYWLMIPFYEMLPVFFMLIASAYYLVVKEKRTFFNLCVIWWWVLSMIMYSWAGERMPWLSVHPLLPMIILAGKMFGEILDGEAFGNRGWVKDAAIAMFVLLSMASVHGAFNLCFYGKGANPRESFIYVQSSVDTTLVTQKVKNLAHALKSTKWSSEEFRKTKPEEMEIVVEDYCSWPFAWYLRDFTRVAYPPKQIPSSDVGKPVIFSGIEDHASPTHDKDTLDMLTGDMLNGAKKTSETQYYVPFRYKLREWWAPDEQKWWRAPFAEKMSMLYDRFMYRDVWNDLGSYDFVVYIRKDLEKYWLGY